MTQGIYVIRNTVTSEEYIGSAHNIAARWRQHIKRLQAGHHQTPKLQRAWEQYGESAFAFDILREVEQEVDLLLREAEAMRERAPVYNVNILDPVQIAAAMASRRALSAEHERKRKEHEAIVRQRIEEMSDSAVRVYACPCCGALHHLFWREDQLSVCLVTRDEVNLLKRHRVLRELAAEFDVSVLLWEHVVPGVE